MRDWLYRYGKSVAAVVAAAVTAASSYATGGIDSGEWVQVAIAATAAAGVWLAPNLPGADYVKTGIAALLAGLNGAVAYLDGGLDGGEIANLLFVVVGALAVGLAPSESRGQHPDPYSPR